MGQRWIRYGLMLVALVAVAFGFVHYGHNHRTASPNTNWLASESSGNSTIANAAGTSNGAATSNGVQSNGAASTSVSSNVVTTNGVSSDTQSNNVTSSSPKQSAPSNQAASSQASNVSNAASSNTTSTSTEGSTANTANSTNVAATNSTNSTNATNATGSSASSSATNSPANTTANTAANTAENTSANTASARGNANNGSFTLIVSEDKGATVIGKETVPIQPGENLMDYTKQYFKVQTAYGGGFVVAINGIKSQWTDVPASQRQPVDWFLYVNQKEAPVGATSIVPQPGDVDRWDYHRWDPSTGKG